MSDITYRESDAMEAHRYELDMAFDVLFEEVMKRIESQEVIQEKVIDNYAHLGISSKYEVSN
jgi:hypothetical protein